MNIATRPNALITPCIDTDAGGWLSGERNLLCPVCSDDYTHFDTPRLEASADNWQANWGGRGDLAVIPMWSECGSKWEVCVGFHKGQSAIFVRVTKSCRANQASEATTPVTP